MNNIKETEAIYIKDLNANDEFCLPGQSTVYVCDARHTQDNMTRVDYRVPCTPIRAHYARVNLSVVYRVK